MPTETLTEHRHPGSIYTVVWSYPNRNSRQQPHRERRPVLVRAPQPVHRPTPTAVPAAATNSEQPKQEPVAAVDRAPLTQRVQNVRHRLQRFHNAASTVIARARKTVDDSRQVIRHEWREHVGLNAADTLLEEMTQVQSDCEATVRDFREREQLHNRLVDQWQHQRRLGTRIKVMFRGKPDNWLEWNPGARMCCTTHWPAMPVPNDLPARVSRLSQQLDARGYDSKVQELQQALRDTYRSAHLRLPGNGMLASSPTTHSPTPQPLRQPYRMRLCL